ncbi:restriction endonuclease subunit S [Luxibacter massiliensis]|uniref:restriction endonuclease subunit S n=1 Tax=Luxibacter massiliensis TaxID=2219695 RepID=UPI000F0557B6|nr:restriction endonuclease subunit S [Luxibacter massiliensis]
MTGQQLKNSILQMAVQGKLVPQDPNDEPASVLLERIRAEKEQLIKEGKIKKEKNPSIIFRGADNLPYEKVGKNEPVCIADEVPFEIPENWEWVRLKNLVKKEIKRGKSPKYTVSSNIQVFAQKCNVKAGGIDMTLAKYLDDTVFPKYSEEECMRDSDIVINSTGNGTLGRIGMFHDSDRINENIIVPDSHVTVIRASEFLSADYIFYVLNYYQPYLEKSCSGSTNQTELKPAVISELFIPVPPVNEQTRIITKLIEALNLSKLYGEKEILLQEYNQDFPEQLKKSILQYAVQGKLVPQNPSDEPAVVLLERIRVEKQKLIAEGKIKKAKHESVIFRRDNSHYEKLDGIECCIDDKLPFEIPESWCWVRFGTALVNRDAERIPLSVAQREKLQKKYDYYGASGVIDKVDQYLFDKPLLLIGEDGANLLLRSKPIAFIASGQYWVNNHAHVIDSVGGVDLRYIALFINAINLAPYVTGTAQPKMNQEKLNSILVPLPPVAEQHRIVTAFKEIVAIIR